jgi:cytoskeleton protein RodZ
MSEAIDIDQSVVQVQPELTAGAMLRSARELAGLHVAALAVSMKVPVKKLEALESDRLDLLPDSVFVRALASSVCRTLKIDPVPILAKLPQSAIPRLGVEQARINTPYYAPGHQQRLAIPTALTKPSVLAVITLLFAAAILVFLPRSQSIEKIEDGVQVGVAVPAANGAADEKNAGVPIPSQAAAVSNSQALAIDAKNPGTQPAETLIESKSGVLPAAVAVPSVPLDIVTFKVRGTSWVDVTDGKGVTLLRKTLTSGESISASGELPLSVVVGRSDLTEVAVRGVPFPLDAFSKDNVARFEVR